MAAPASLGPEPRASLAALSQIILLTLWLGAAAFFSAVVAPAAFAVLPARELAGALVAKVLPPVFMAGGVAGLVALLVEDADGRHRYRVGRVAATCITALACAAAQLGVAPRIAALRAALSAPLASLPADDPQRIAFGRLHMLSVGSLGVAILASAVAIVLAVLTLRPRGPR